MSNPQNPQDRPLESPQDAKNESVQEQLAVTGKEPLTKQAPNQQPVTSNQ